MYAITCTFDQNDHHAEIQATYNFGHYLHVAEKLNVTHCKINTGISNEQFSQCEQHQSAKKTGLQVIGVQLRNLIHPGKALQGHHCVTFQAINVLHLDTQYVTRIQEELKLHNAHHNHPRHKHGVPLSHSSNKRSCESVQVYT